MNGSRSSEIEAVTTVNGNNLFRHVFDFSGPFDGPQQAVHPEHLRSRQGDERDEREETAKNDSSLGQALAAQSLRCAADVAQAYGATGDGGDGANQGECPGERQQNTGESVTAGLGRIRRGDSRIQGTIAI